jgi:hypothetical protein
MTKKKSFDDNDNRTLFRATTSATATHITDHLGLSLERLTLLRRIDFTLTLMLRTQESSSANKLSLLKK